MMSSWFSTYNVDGKTSRYASRGIWLQSSNNFSLGNKESSLCFILFNEENILTKISSHVTLPFQNLLTLIKYLFDHLNTATRENKLQAKLLSMLKDSCEFDNEPTRIRSLLVAVFLNYHLRSSFDISLP